MESVNDLMETKNFFQASEKLQKIGEIVSAKDQDLENCDEDQLKAFKAVKEEYATALEKMHFVLSQKWDQSYTFTETQQKEGPRSIQFRFAKLTSDILHAMDTADMLTYRISKLSMRILQSLLKPIFENKVSLTVGNEFLELSILGEGSSDALTALTNLQDIFQAFEAAFDISFTRSDGESVDNLISMIGECIGQDFVQYLLTQCLSPAIPNSQEDLSEYEYVRDEANKLQDKLMQLNFLTKGKKAKNIEKYIRNY